MSIKQAIEAAKKAVSFRRESAEQEASRLDEEVQILQRLATHQERATAAKAEYEGLTRWLSEWCDPDFVPSIGQQIAMGNGEVVLAQLASQLAAQSAIKAHKAEILAEFKHVTVDMQEAELAEFIKGNSAVLKRHGAI